MKMILLLCVLVSTGSKSPGSDFPCAQKTVVKRPYGMVEQRVNCDLSEEWKFVSEYKGKKKHGVSLAFHKERGWRSDSGFFTNGVEEGQSIVWDSNGNIIGKFQYKNGKQVGKQEAFWSPGKPQTIKNFNRLGEEEGPQKEWWENGRLKYEGISKKGQIISGTEYYPSGKPRVSYTIQFNPKAGVFTSKYTSASSWSPDGRPTGSVVNGTGSYMLWSAEPDTPFVVHQEFRKDGELITVKELDSAQVEAWIKAQSKPK